MPELFKEGSIYKVRYVGLDGKKHTSSTGETEVGRARQVLDASKLGDIELAARAKALTADSLGKIMAGRKVRCVDALADWKTWFTLNAEPNTVHNHDTTLIRFFDVSKAATAPVTKIDVPTIDRFVNTTDNVKTSTREQRLAAVRSFFEYCSAKGLCVGNPARLVRVRLNRMTHEQKESAPRVPFTREEYNRIMLAAEGFDKYATAIGYWTGMRLSDIACLEWSAFTDREIIVWTRKGESRIALPLADPVIGGGGLVPVLMQIMLEHQHHPQYCFPEEREIALDTKKRARLSVYYGRLLNQVGIEGKSFHCHRHAFATRLKKDRRTLEEIGRLLGHAGTDVTKGYVHP